VAIDLAEGRLDAAKRFGLDEFLSAYHVFGRAGETGALKVVLSRH
jgi:hypothetical protein